MESVWTLLHHRLLPAVEKFLTIHRLKIEIWIRALCNLYLLLYRFNLSLVSIRRVDASVSTCRLENSCSSVRIGTSCKLEAKTLCENEPLMFILPGSLRGHSIFKVLI